MADFKLYIGTEHGLYQLECQDNTWHLLHLGLFGKNITGLAVAPKMEKLYAAVQGYGVYQAKLPLALKPAIQWQQILAANAHTLLIDQVDKNKLWVGVEPPGLYHSRDDGQTWLDLSDGLLSLSSAVDWSYPTPPYQAQVRTMVQQPGNPHTLLAGIAIGGVVRSQDGGFTWSTSTEGLDEEVQVLVAHPQQPHFYLAATGAGLYLSKDGGQTWAEAAELLVDFAVTALISVTGVCLVALSNTPPGNWIENATTTLYRSDDLGHTWNEVDLATPRYITALGDDLDLSGSLYAGTQDGSVLVSDDEGQSWQTIAQVDGAINLFCLPRN